MHADRSIPLLCVVLALCIGACSRDPVPGTPEAAAEGDRLMRRMSDVLAGAREFRFSTTEVLERIGPSSERSEFTFSRTVTVRRPNELHFELGGSEQTRANLAAYYDGTTLTLRDDAGGAWAATDVPATLDEMLDHVASRYGLPVAIADVIYSVPYEAFVGRESAGGFAGREAVGGVDCSRVAYTDDYIDVQVWIPVSGQPLPRRVELVYKQAPGAPKARIDFVDWNLSPQIAEGMFAFQPTGSSTEIAFEEMVNRLLSGGNAASAAAADPATAGGSSQP